MYVKTCVLLVFLAACAPGPPPPADGTHSDPSARRVMLTDRRGERWDITDAVVDYGFNRRFFEFGIGRHAIPPINAPEMSQAGDRNHPPNRSGHQVISVELEGEQRSYPIRELTRHEIVNETVGHTQAAVAY